MDVLTTRPPQFKMFCFIHHLKFVSLIFFYINLLSPGFSHFIMTIYSPSISHYYWKFFNVTGKWFILFTNCYLSINYVLQIKGLSAYQKWKTVYLKLLKTRLCWIKTRFSNPEQKQKKNKFYFWLLYRYLNTSLDSTYLF